MTGCSCPRTGEFYCDWCANLAIRAGVAISIAPLERTGWQGSQRTTSAEPIMSMAEEAFQARIVRQAKSLGYRVYHTHDSRRSEAGFPDLVLTKPGRLIFVECKSARGKLTQEQAVWLDLLKQSVAGVESYTWRPKDWESIVAILQQKETRHGSTDAS